jgi:hypothetical protein
MLTDSHTYDMKVKTIGPIVSKIASSLCFINTASVQIIKKTKIKIKTNIKKMAKLKVYKSFYEGVL